MLTKNFSNSQNNNELRATQGIETMSIGAIISPSQQTGGKGKGKEKETGSKRSANSSSPEGKGKGHAKKNKTYDPVRDG